MLNDRSRFQKNTLFSILSHLLFAGASKSWNAQSHVDIEVTNNTTHVCSNRHYRRSAHKPIEVMMPKKPRFVLVLIIAAFTFAFSSALSSAADFAIATTMSRSGPGKDVADQLSDGIRLAVEEANAESRDAQIKIEEFDDRSTEEGARAAANLAGNSSALIAIGPNLTSGAVSAGPVFADFRMAMLAPAAGGDAVSKSATTFKTIFSTSEMGGILANHLGHVLGGRRAIVIYYPNGFGTPLAEGFKRTAEYLGIKTEMISVQNSDEAISVARKVASDSTAPAIVLGMTDMDSVPVLAELRRGGAKGFILCGSANGQDSYPKFFDKFDEEIRSPGYFTDGVFAVTPIILDTSSAEALDFSHRFEKRYKRAPTWLAVQGYDAARIAILATRSVSNKWPNEDLKSRRTRAISWLSELKTPEVGNPGLAGPIWFSPDRTRAQSGRIGRFRGRVFESAPEQLIPLDRNDEPPTQQELAENVVVELAPGHFARRQKVIYSGFYLNSVSDVDFAKSTFQADFYFWMRFNQQAAGLSDPTDVVFPDLITKGAFDLRQPVEKSTTLLEDGTTYHLYHINGLFSGAFDAHMYPFDKQNLVIRFFNRRAASNHIVYALDRRSISSASSELANPSLSITAGGGAFDRITQWHPLAISQRRDDLVTKSSLGNPNRQGTSAVREVSGYRMDVSIARNSAATLSKTLLPLGIMTLMMFASLWLPISVVNGRAGVPVTSVIAGSVLLSSVNSQLGPVGYTMAIEYVFYAFFLLGLCCVIATINLTKFKPGEVNSRYLMIDRAVKIFFVLITVVFGAVGVVLAGV